MNRQFWCVRLSSVLHEPHSIQCSLICYSFTTTTTFSLKKRPFATNSFLTSFSHIKNYILPCIIFSVSRLCIISIKNKYSINFLFLLRLAWRGAHAHMCVIVWGWHCSGWCGHGQGLGCSSWPVRPRVEGMVVGKLSSRTWRWQLVTGSRGGTGSCGDSRRWCALLAAALRRVLGVLSELDGDVAGDFRGAPCALGGRPGLWVQVLATVVTALGKTGAIESRVRPIHLLFCITLHKEIHWHHTGTLREYVRMRERQWGDVMS